MALLAGSLASIASGIVGSFVVIKRIAFIAGSISHAVLGGMGLFLFLRRTYDIPWLHPIHGALITAIIAAVLIGFIRMRFKEREDTVIAALWVFGMSIGIIFISLTPGYNVELMNFLFGNILWASNTDLGTLLGLDIVVCSLTLMFQKKFLLISFDEKQARLQKIPVAPLYYLLLILIALTVVLLIQIVGAILVIAFLTLPAACANTLTHRFSRMMPLAVILGICITFLGLFSSFSLNWPPGATIALTSALAYSLTLVRNARNRLT